MTSLFRSVEMVKVRLFIDRSAARATLEELGEHGLLQLDDLNQDKSEFQRSFSSDIRKCQEMQRKLRALELSVQECFPMRFQNKEEPISREELNTVTLEELDKHLSSLEETVQEMNGHWKSLNSHRQQLLEHHYVLVLGSHLFRPGYLSLLKSENQGEEGDGGRRDNIRLMMNGKSNLNPSYTPVDIESPFLRLIAGVISLESLSLFQRLIFRVARGNCLSRFSEIEEVFYDEEKKENVRNCVFVIFCPGKELGRKMEKLCETFGAHLYPLPDDEASRRSLLAQVSNRLRDIEAVVTTTHSQRLETLSEIGAKLALWWKKVSRELMIFHCMNMLNYDTSRNVYIAQGWTPQDQLGLLESLLHQGCQVARAQVSSVLEHRVSDSVPPTYFRTNKFTTVFQNIVESYGIATYRELNPACFTIITFPFLFAVMFGDVGHGLLMCLFASYLIIFERKFANQKLNEILQFCYDGRYIILLMGIFSLYTGLIYNEFFGVAMNIFGSRWKFNASSNFACGIDNCVDPSQSLPPKNIYPIGFDPIWSQALNGLTFFNSYKMKLSIVLGVAQMVMGIFLSYLNARYFQQSLDIFYVFLPQIIFMNAIFGYLVILIFIKWSIDWNSSSCLSNPSCRPPDLKQILIGMFMNPTSLPLDMQLFPGQKVVQIVLLVCAIVSVPWMLLPKPLILRRRYKRLENSVPWRRQVNNEEQQQEKDAQEEDFGEIFVHQLIHTIEFVLGAVSNTASYLRLWALSLAHSELSQVFLEKVLYGSMALNNAFAVWMGFLLWFGLTIGVLCLMESLSAFLHALRLHWVEFQNKFYQCEGRKFVPFRFEE